MPYYYYYYYYHKTFTEEKKLPKIINISKNCSNHDSEHFEFLLGSKFDSVRIQLQYYWDAHFVLY